jgi:uncharacterized repeat protein (TIGR01451 family)
MSHRTASCLVVIAVFAFALFSTAAAHAQVVLTIGLAQGSDPNGEPQYTATVTNTDPTVPASNVDVKFTLPHWELPISPPPSGGCLFTTGPGNLVAECTLASLAPLAAHDFVIAVHPTNTDPQDVTAVATATNAAQPVSAFVTSTITGVGLAEMQITMTSTNPGKVGEALTFNLTVTNIQDDDARNVFALLVLPKMTTFVSATKGCTHGTVVTCKLGQMSPGTSKSVTITVLPTISGWQQATAGLRFTTPDRDFTNNSTATSIWINP